MQAVPTSTSDVMRSPGHNTNGYYVDEHASSSAPFGPEYTNGGGPMRATTPGGGGGMPRYMPYNTAALQQHHQQQQQLHAAEMVASGACWSCGFAAPTVAAMMVHKCAGMQHPPPPPHSGEDHSSPGSSVSLEEQFFEHTATPPPARPKDDASAAEILDLDSHKVHVYQQQLEADKQRRMKREFQPDPMMQFSMEPRAKARNNGGEMPDYPHPHQQMQPPMMGGYPHHQQAEMMGMVPPPPQYLHQQQPAPPMQMPPQQTPPPPSRGNGVQSPPSHGGNQSWKSNEARRPKTYNCPACNKWFTSSGHLKRHYNTTLHKNAVKQGAPDPLKEGGVHRTLPPVVHHDSSSATASPVPSLGEDTSSRSDDNTPTTMQPPLHPQSNASSPPNREAGLSESLTLAALELSTPGGLPVPPSPNSNNLNNNSNSNNPLHHSSNSSFISLSSNIISSSSSLATLATTNPHPPPNNNGPLQPLVERLEASSHLLPTQAGLTLLHSQLPRSMASSMVVAPLTVPVTSITSHYADPYYPGDHAPTYTQLTEAVPLPSFAQFHHYAYEFAPPPRSSPTMWTSASMNYHHQEVPSSIRSQYSESSLDSGGERVLSSSPLAPSTPSPRPVVPTSTVDDADVRKPKGRGRGRGRGRPPSIQMSVGNGVHVCVDCDKEFNKACYLTQHNKSFHAGDKPFKCNKCGKRFTSECLYQDHLGKHAGDKPYKCEICPKQFNHKTDLRRHLCLHTGEKPYTCEMCGKGFIRKDHMLKHCATHQRSGENRGRGKKKVVEPMF
jgi:Zinc-finger double-stranded RNA-binding/Zinc finger, C2H2 type